jgi:hypothetical protein
MENLKDLYLFIGICFLSAIIQITAVIIFSKKNKNNKKVHKLYFVLYEAIFEKHYITSLCSEIRNLNSITIERKELLLKDFNKQKPNFFRHRSFYFNKIYKGRAYWWCNKSLEKSTEQRKMFIKILVDKTNTIKRI